MLLAPRQTQTPATAISAPETTFDYIFFFFQVRILYEIKHEHFDYMKGKKIVVNF